MGAVPRIGTCPLSTQAPANLARREGEGEDKGAAVDTANLHLHDDDIAGINAEIGGSPTFGGQKSGRGDDLLICQ